jgi:hypothetical protein
MMGETIVAVAVRAFGVVLSVPKPGRHHTVLNTFSQATGLNMVENSGPDDQGFLTSAGRFVGRIEAAKIAVDEGQIEALQWPPQLYSEDLW